MSNQIAIVGPLIKISCSRLSAPKAICGRYPPDTSELYGLGPLTDGIDAGTWRCRPTERVETGRILHCSTRTLALCADGVGVAVGRRVAGAVRVRVLLGLNGLVSGSPQRTAGSPVV